MSKKEKKTKISLANTKKGTVKLSYTSNKEKSLWMFDEIDRDGVFRFDINREEFKHKEFMDKMISYSNMTWDEIISQTHDDNKSKNHTLDYDSLSKEAKERILTLKLEQDTDRIFSFALGNKLRVIGLRENEKFHVKWYDPEHKFCPSNKKHT